MRSLINFRSSSIGSINSVNNLVRSFDPNYSQVEPRYSLDKFHFNELDYRITNSDLLMGQAFDT